MNLLRNEQPVQTIFDLLGQKENDMTAGLAYCLANSDVLLKSIVKAIDSKYEGSEQAFVHIQTSRKQQGITDVEIRCGAEFFAILEAKRGPQLPSDAQLSCYASVLKAKAAPKQLCYLVTVSNATNDIAAIRYPAGKIDGFPLVHLSWRIIKKFVDRAISDESNTAKAILRQYSTYLHGVLGMETMQSNMVYVVSLAQGMHEAWNLNWIDVVEKHNKYYYPVGGGWPDPPNYVAFRYNGKLQAIRHVRSHKVFTNPRQVFPKATSVEAGPHYCLELDPPIIPTHDVPTGSRIRQANRCWCMIDTLLTAPSISDALTETERRVAEAKT